MTEEELKALEAEALCDDEPWQAELSDGFRKGGRVVTDDGEGLVADTWGTYLNENESRFDAEMRTARAIVAAHNALPGLIAALRGERRRAEVAEARAAWHLAMRDALQAQWWASLAEDEEEKWKEQAAELHARERAKEALDRLRTLGVEP